MKNFKRILFYHLSNDEMQLIPGRKLKILRDTVKRKGQSYGNLNFEESQV